MWDGDEHVCVFWHSMCVYGMWVFDSLVCVVYAYYVCVSVRQSECRPTRRVVPVVLSWVRGHAQGLA